MKTIEKLFGIILTILFLNLSFHSKSQQGVIWVKIPNAANYFNLSEGKISSTDKVVSDLFTRNNVSKVFKAVPSSKRESLKDLYQIECECDEHQLLMETARLKEIFVNPEIGPHYTTLVEPNDYNLSFSYDYALDLINATGAWNLTEGDTSIVIGITDAGYDYFATELYGKYNSISNGIIQSNIAHGTAVATLAAGNTNNGFGKSSIGFNSRLDLRGMNYDELLASSYHGADVVNASWAASCYYSAYAQEIIDEIYNNGTIIVAAAGNGSTCNNSSAIVYPASYNHVISVTSVGPWDNHEQVIGNPATCHQHNAYVDICAPGYDVACAINGNGFVTANGTSFAAPIVSGTIALMLSVNPCLNADDIEYILKASADTTALFNNPNYAYGMGAGRLDAEKAVMMAKQFSTINAETSIHTICEFNSRVISLNSIGGVAPYEIVWSTGENGNSTMILNPGTYSVDIKDSNSCRYHQVFQIDTLVELSYSMEVSHVSCFGLDDARIEVITSSGQLVEAAWSNGTSNTVLENLSPGIYEVELIDSNGCSTFDQVTVIEPQEMILSVLETDPNEYNQGSIDVTVSGGSGEYSYSWNTGATTEDLTNVAEGVYQVTVHDQNGCMKTKMAVLTLVSVAGITENKMDLLTVYPNPSSDIVSISYDFSGTGKAIFTDINGKIVKSVLVHGQNPSINLDELSSGDYFVVISENEEKIGEWKLNVLK